ncbi:MAG: hypothetical protein WAT71_12770 [Ignavibacteria bacterium]
MQKTFKVKINSKGEIKLLEPIRITKDTNAILTIIDEESNDNDLNEKDLISLNELSLAEDWNSEADMRWDKILI